MKTKLVRWGTAALVILGLMIGTVGLAGAEELDRRGGPGSGWASGTPPYAQAVQPLDQAESAALNRAIAEEYGALNTYKAAIAELGNVYPFSQIVRAEQQHVNALSRLFTKYSLPIPADPGLTGTPTFSSLTNACQVGVDAEIADAALYDELLKVTDNADLIQVFKNLQRASLNAHLPAFETCN
jgi:hypothetical protein